jgi:hypothetical protein
MVAIHPITPCASRASHAARSFRDPTDGDEYGTLICDGLGRICGNGAVAEELFGAGRSRLTGLPISSLIPGIDLRGPSPDPDTNYLSSLCASENWQQFDAMDIFGCGFVLNIRLSRRMMGSREAFVLDFFCPR